MLVTSLCVQSKCLIINMQLSSNTYFHIFLYIEIYNKQNMWLLYLFHLVYLICSTFMFIYKVYIFVFFFFNITIFDSNVVFRFLTLILKRKCHYVKMDTTASNNNRHNRKARKIFFMRIKPLKYAFRIALLRSF